MNIHIGIVTFFEAHGVQFSTLLKNEGHLSTRGGTDFFKSIVGTSRVSILCETEQCYFMEKMKE